MKKDIENRSDVELLVNSFYDQVKQDDLVRHFFTEVVSVNWEKHLPVMYNFWENIIFHTGVAYMGNPMDIHMKLHQQSPMTKKHFDRWIQLFTTTVDQLYKGPHAEQAKQRALSIATVMQIKIAGLPDEKPIY
jgi:hemoglobin